MKPRAWKACARKWDAALAIFPIGGTSKLLKEACTPSEGACKRALDAARDARQRIEALNKRRQEAGDPPIRYGLALHVGDVMYGNIGVPRAGAVLDHGGEVLRFIGDAALAIFPIGGTSKLLEEACTPSEGACKRALDAARDARQRIEALNKRRQEAGDPPIRYGLALHVGDVMYGNIGVPQRLEFTVIGKAANEAARLEGMCKELGEPILISSAFPRCFPGEMRSLGAHSLRGVSEPQEVFALSD